MSDRGARLIRARSWLLLVLAVAGLPAAASDRFVPGEASFVVARLTTSRDPPLAALMDQVRASPADLAKSAALAAAYLQRARTQQEPRFFGRAEALLAPWAARHPADSQIVRLHAQTLQFRHEFAGAERALDTLLRLRPDDLAARAQRASLLLVRGDFAGARADCARLLQGDSDAQTIGVACLAEALASSGSLARGRGLLDSYAAAVKRASGNATSPAARAYLFGTQAQLHDRAGASAGAQQGYAEALQLTPGDDAVRAALVDLLIGSGDLESARGLLAVERPSLGLLVRRAIASRGAERDGALAQARAWLTLEDARGDSAHHREAAMLAMFVERDDAKALLAARRNFETQRELADIRLLARAAVNARDANAIAELQDWLQRTGYQDFTTTRILARIAEG